MDLKIYKKRLILSIILYFIVFGYAQASSFNKELILDNKTRVETTDTDKKININRESSTNQDCEFTDEIYLSASTTPGTWKLGETTKNLGNTYSETDLGDFDNGQDKIYKIRIDQEDIGLFDINLKTYTANVGIAVFNGCPSENKIIVKSTNSSDGEQIIENVLINFVEELYLMVDCKPTEEKDFIVKYDLKISKRPSTPCTSPQIISIKEVQDSTAQIHWNPALYESSWDIKYGIKDFNLESEGETLSNALSPSNLQSLSPGTEYDVYIRSKCSETEISEWAGPHKFKTSGNTQTYSITASVDGIGGTITHPNTSVNLGADEEFTITPDLGYVLESLVDNNESKTVDASGKYKLTNIQANHTIVVKFKQTGTPNPTTVSLSASVDGIGGTITHPNTSVNLGADEEFTITPDSGYELESLIDNNESKTVDANGKYKLTNIQANHTIIVKFKKSTKISEDSSIEINVYPNPTNDFLNIQASDEIARIEILSLDGKLLDYKNVNNNNYQYNTSTLTEGNYLIRIHTEKNITIKLFSVN